MSNDGTGWVYGEYVKITTKKIPDCAMGYWGERVVNVYINYCFVGDIKKNRRDFYFRGYI